MSEFDPATNGHKPVAEPAGVKEGSGRGVLLVTIVSAMTGLNLMLGAGVGGLIAIPLGLKEGSLGVFMATTAGLGGILGVVLGVRVAHRFGGMDRGDMDRGGMDREAKSLKWSVAGGVAGLVGAVALAGLARFPFVPILAIMLPGIGAWLGDRFADRSV